MDTLTHPQQFRGIASYNLHWFDIVHNDTPTTCYGSASDLPTRGKHKNLCWQPHIILNHKSVILSLPFRRIYICEVVIISVPCPIMTYSPISMEFLVSKLSVCIEECAPTTTFGFILRARATEKIAPSPIFAPFRRAIRRARQYFML